MASLKDVKAKIGGVKKTRQITKAMNMVAASRLRGAQLKMEAFRPYAEKFAEVLGNVANRSGEETNALLVPRDEIRSCHLVLLTSDRGLCGGFNSNLIDTAKRLITSWEHNQIKVSVTNFGKKGRDWCRRRQMDRRREHIGVVGGRFGFNIASSSGQQLMDGFFAGEFDEVHIVYAKFHSMARQIPVVQQLLPIPSIGREEQPEAASGEGFLAEHICEPSPAALLSALLPKNVYIQIYGALLETSTSEHAARMTAMDNATKACNDMLDELTLAYNKARQSTITKELMDIVGGAEALRG